MADSARDICAGAPEAILANNALNPRCGVHANMSDNTGSPAVTRNMYKDKSR